MRNTIILVIILNVFLLFFITNQIFTQDISKAEKTPTINNSYLRSAKMYYELRDYPKVIEALELAILLEPDNAEARTLLNESKQQLQDRVNVSKGPGRSPEAERMPKDASVLVQNAYTAIQEKRYDDAAAIADLILQKDLVNRDALYIKGKVNDIKYAGITEYLKTIRKQEKLKSDEYLKEISVPYQDTIRFPPKEQWEEISSRILPDLNKIVEENKRKTEQLRIITTPLEEPLPEKIENALNTIISFEFLHTPLQDIVTFLREKTNINMIIDPEAGTIPITLKLKNVPLRIGLRYILPRGYEYVVEGDILHIYKQKMELRVYDVRDILINLDDKAPLEFDITASISQLSVQRTEIVKMREPSERVFDLIELIATTIEPLSWSYRTGVIGISGVTQRRINVPGQGEGSINTRIGQPGDLIIVNTKHVHGQIEDLLASLRSSQNLQVSIEARFISVTDEFLEDIGSDFSKFFSDRATIETGAQNVIGDLGTQAVQGLSLNYSILTDSMLKGFIRAVQESKGSEILTSPRITLSNTQRGNIAVVRTTNYIQSTSVAEGVVTPIIGTIPEGTTFDVRPIVSADRKYVYLEVTPSVFQIESIDSFTFTGVDPDTTFVTGGTGVVSIPPTTTVQLPTINVSLVSVTVCIPDKGTLMIGGLGSINKDRLTTGIPVLSKIPVIKKLFSRDRKENRRSNLIILLKPTIIIKEEHEVSLAQRAYRTYD
jgi:type II secretory pathway component GspD/PulD (secretin)